MATAGRNVSTFVGAVEQLAAGAVAESRVKTDFSDLISKHIAYLLFDDFETIGDGLKNGVQTIHLMNLNGVYVPISSILFALADTFEKEQAVSKIVKVSIKLPGILYPKGKNEKDYPGRGAWEIQRQDMLERGKIEAHFLGNFSDILKNGNFR